jgi:glycosyltransferase involved in cell wall biosynthesis
VVSYLTEELVRQGHQVTLFASGDSVTAAELVPICPEALRLNPNCSDSFAHHILQLEKVYQNLSRFDLVHFHIDYFHFPLSRRHSFAHITTLHGRLDIPDLVPLYREFKEMPLVSISDAQRRLLPWAHWQATVYHGLPLDSFTFRPNAGKDLVFLGRISPEKRADRAIEIARRTGLHLKIAAKVDRGDRNYYEEVFKPLLARAGSQVEFLGEVGGAERDHFLGDAYALLFPIDWPEPFGLVMIEALACGTPVIAWPCGSVPEILNDGVTGFLVDSIEEAVAAVGRVADLDRRVCRQVFEERFSAARMASNYLAVYERLLRRRAVEGQSRPRRGRTAALTAIVRKGIR